MSLYRTLADAEQQFDELLNRMRAATNQHDVVERARSCFKEGFENLVYAARDQIAQEGTHYECCECGRDFPLHHGANGCPAGHQAEAELIGE